MGKKNKKKQSLLSNNDIQEIESLEQLRSAADSKTYQIDKLSSSISRMEEVTAALEELSDQTKAYKACIASGLNPEEEYPSNIRNEQGEIVVVMKKRWQKFLAKNSTANTSV